MKAVTVLCSDVINSLGLVRTLGEVGYKVECLCYGNNTNYILSSRYICTGMNFKSCKEAVHYLINDYPTKDIKPVLFTLPDPPAYYVDLYQELLETKFVLFRAGKPGNIVYWMDKQNISDLARKHGLTVPWTIKLSKDDAIPALLDYPVFVKSANSTEGGKVDEGICHTENELKNKISHLVADNFIIMPYIKKVEENNFFGIALHDHIYIDYFDVRTRFPEDGYGHYNIFHICDYDDFHSRLIAMIKETKYQGLFDIEFLVGEDGKKYFMEVNFRVDGAIYKLAHGINLPDYWCRLVDLPKEELPERLITKSESFSGMTEIDDFKVSVLSGKVNFFIWVWQFLWVDRRMLCNFKDLMPLLIKIRDNVKYRCSLIKCRSLNLLTRIIGYI